MMSAKPDARHRVGLTREIGSSVDLECWGRDVLGVGQIIFLIWDLVMVVDDCCLLGRQWFNNTVHSFGWMWISIACIEFVNPWKLP